MKRKVYIYRAFERFWHWMQAILILFLAMTGFEVHGTLRFFGYQNAVEYHIFAAYAFIVLIVFAIFWHLSTGEWRQYLPTAEHLKAQIDYYLFGIFRNAPHPTKKTMLSKLNPLQKLVYLGLKILIVPTMVISGLLYLYYRYPQHGGIQALNVDSIKTIALFHTAGAYLLISFVVVHLYLITTGMTATSNLLAMITGYEEQETDAQTDQTMETNDNTNEIQVVEAAHE